VTETANIVVLAKADNVGVALRDIEANASAQAAEGAAVVAREAIPLGHKIALVPIAAGDAILRFGVPVGLVVRVAQLLGRAPGERVILRLRD